MAHFKKQIQSSTSPGMFLHGTLCRNYAPKLPFQLSCLVVCRNWYKSTYRAHIDFFHTINHMGSKSLTHCWKGEIKGSNLHYFLAQESSIKANFKGTLACKHIVFLKMSSSHGGAGSKPQLRIDRTRWIFGLTKINLIFQESPEWDRLFGAPLDQPISKN